MMEVTNIVLMVVGFTVGWLVQPYVVRWFKKKSGYRKITPTNPYPMYKLSNGDIVQFLVYDDKGREVYRQFNNHKKKFLYLREEKIWATGDGDVLPHITIEKEIK